MVKCIIIDDESHAVEYLTAYVKRIPNFEIVASFNDPVLALTDILNGPFVDLILMDIDMPEISGLELSNAIRHKTDKLVITTAHTKYGYEAFEVNADAYLLKPYNFTKFMSVINKLFNSIKVEKKEDDDERFFFIRTSKANDFKIIKILYNDIIAIESNLNYVKIHTDRGTTETYMSLSDISLQLEHKTDLVRFQRSFIVNKLRIQQIDGNSITMDGGLKISVGNYYKKSFAEFISKHLIKAKRND